MDIRDSSMILIQEFLGYGLLGFHLDINLVPFSRVLLGKHSNSRFKEVLVEKPCLIRSRDGILQNPKVL